MENKIILFDAKEKEFKTRGLGSFDQVMSAVIMQDLNGRYELNMRVGNKDRMIEHLAHDRILFAKDVKNQQAFRIYMVRKDLQSTTIMARHISYDLNYSMIPDTNVVQKATFGVLEQLQESASGGNVENFKFWSDIDRVANGRFVRKNMTEAILGENPPSIMSRWGGEVERDNWNFNIYNKMGRDKGYTIKYAKNLLNYDEMLDFSNIITKVMPIGFDGLLLPELYVESPTANKYPFEKIGLVRFEDVASEDSYHENENALPLHEAQDLLKKKAKELFTTQNIGDPEVSAVVDMIDLSQTEEYKDIKFLERVFLGDTVYVEHPHYKESFKSRVVGYTWDIVKGRYNDIQIGQLGSYGAYVGNINNLLQEAEDQKEKEPSKWKQAVDNATGLINEAMGGYITKTREELFIADSEDLTEAMNVWRWNLNGLGFSRNGVEGPYELAMTGDGSIVADMITTGKLTGNVIETNAINGEHLSTDAIDYIMSFTQQGNFNNYIRNSTLRGGDNFWEVLVEGHVGEENSWGLAKVSEHTIKGNGKRRQRVHLQPNEEYTLSVDYLIQTGAGSIKITLETESGEQIVAIEEQGVGEKKAIYRFNSENISDVFVVIETKGSNEAMPIFMSDLMLALGNISTWSSAPDELYAKHISFDALGIHVARSDGLGEARMTHAEFAIEYNGEKVLTVNKDMSEMHGIKIGQGGIHGQNYSIIEQDKKIFMLYKGGK